MNADIYTKKNGEEVSDHINDIKEKDMFCNECGSRVPDGADFCPECGNRVSEIVMPDNMVNGHPELSVPDASIRQAALITCLVGIYQGKSFPVQDEVIIGSFEEYAHIVLKDKYVSRYHVSIRFNPSADYYEVKDQSRNGTFLGNGTRLQKDAYTICPHGTIICLGSVNQQFQLV